MRSLVPLALAALLSVASPAASAQAPVPPSPSPSPPPAPAAAFVLEGRLLERGTKRPVAEAAVFLLPGGARAQTDAAGRFIFEGVLAGEHRIVVNLTGYRRLEEGVAVNAGRSGSIAVLHVERRTYAGLEATVIGKAEKRDDTTRSLKTEQFLTLPGAGGDPVKAVQNLPGVARSVGGTSQVIIQGSSPRDTSYLIDDQNVPLVFHFGGLTSVITPEAIGQVDYLSAGYGPEYGRALGGLIGLRTRQPDAERVKGFVFVDTAKAGGLIEGPMGGESSYWLTGRYSHLGLILRAVLKDQEQFDLTVAPSFADAAGLARARLSDTDEFRVLAVASHDQLEFLLKAPLRSDPAVRGNFRNETSFYRLIPQWVRARPSGATTRVSAGLGQDFIRVDVGGNFFDLETWTVSQRAEHEWSPAPRWTSVLGVDNEFVHADVGLRLPNVHDAGGVSDPISAGDLQSRSARSDSALAGAYWRNTIKPEGSKWTFSPSARVDHFSATDETIPAPRLSARFDENEFVHWRAAGGLYAQPPEPQETDPEIGNSSVKAPLSWHATLGREQDFRRGSSRGWTLGTGAFYRLFDRLVIASSRTVARDGVIAPERYNNEGRGDAYGAELLLRADLAPYAGWVSYTLSRSTRREPGSARFPFEFDQTHNLNLVGARDFENNWKLSARARFVTGNPRTPITGGVFDADNDVYLPVRGAFFSRRSPPFFQVDLRVDKKWIHETWILWAYLDVQNVTNHRNQEGVRYAYDYSRETRVTGLPVLPTFGVRGDF